MGISEARRFLDKYYPYIYLHGAYDPTRPSDTEDIKLRIAFSRDKDDRDKPGKSDDDWKCEVVWFENGFCLFLLTRISATLRITLIECYVSAVTLREPVRPHIRARFRVANI